MGVVFLGLCASSRNCSCHLLTHGQWLSVSSLPPPVKKLLLPTVLARGGDGRAAVPAVACTASSCAAAALVRLATRGSQSSHGFSRGGGARAAGARGGMRRRRGARSRSRAGFLVMPGALGPPSVLLRDSRFYGAYLRMRSSTGVSVISSSF